VAAYSAGFSYTAHNKENSLRKSFIVMLTISFILFGGTIGYAETKFAGIVKTVKGSAFVVREAVCSEAVPGMKIQIGDVVKTGDIGSIALIFTDDTIISLGSKSEITIEDYLFEPIEGKLSFIARMIQGTLSFISGRITKLSPGSVRLETPAATIGVRGTHVLVKVER
jgi:hypothetical protein